MGFFGTFLYEATSRRWRPVAPAINDVRQPVRGDQQPDATEPWLLVDIHDSDFTEVTYRPVGHGTGIAYLGITPRTYFDDERASAPTDVAREAQGLADWWRRLHPDAGPDEHGAKATELATYLAQDLEPNDVDLDDEDDDDLDESEVFVEVKTRQFLTSLGLPPPAELMV
jgi:hypothetical protein